MSGGGFVEIKMLQAKWLAGCGALSIAFVSHAALAQQAAPVEETAEPSAPNAEVSGTGIQDIIVTARRQTESLQDTPIAITALDQSTLEKLNVQTVDKIAQVAPNLTISQQSSALTSASVNIRGIGQTDPSFGLEAGVGVYLDGVYVARTAGALFDLVDIERIEVLRGRQGTLFGRNTVGGAIQIISREPQDYFGVTGKVGYGTRNNTYGRIRVDTGLIGNTPIAASFTYHHREVDGYFDNLLTPSDLDPGSRNIDAFGAAVKADLGAFQASYAFDFDDRRGAPGFFQTVALSPQAAEYYSRSPQFGGPALQFPGPDKRLESGLQQPGLPGRYDSRSRSQGHNLTLEYERQRNGRLGCRHCQRRTAWRK